ncbi:TetR/AcrR family transcriptional regulator [Microvirga antarctica]|uniref:TetR/AcrR family transcriptional regulator n=1 Tax=Microvirga antarctica TaxID=2819233 RepID=UPI001B30D4E1|nr:TetR/AcrR family transcriptional regulator [Microvirga antarctica]
MKTPVKSSVSQKRVLDAAAKIFRETGYVQTTMRSVAKESNLKAGSLYYHYRSKDDLIRAVLDLGTRTVISSVKEALNRLPADADCRLRIETAIQAHLSAIVDCGDYTLATRRVFGQIPADIRRENLKLRVSYVSIWQDILQKAQSDGQFRAEANMTLVHLVVLGALNSTIEWFKPDRGSIEKIASDFSSMVLNGLLKQPALQSTSHKSQHPIL